MHQFPLAFRREIMAAQKVSFVFALLLAVAYGQAPLARTPQDFWVAFAQGLATDVAHYIAGLDLFENPKPPQPTPPAQPKQTVFIRGRPFTFPITNQAEAAAFAAALTNEDPGAVLPILPAGFPLPPQAAPAAPSNPAANKNFWDAFWDDVWKTFLQLYGAPQFKPNPAAPPPAQVVPAPVVPPFMPAPFVGPAPLPPLYHTHAPARPVQPEAPCAKPLPPCKGPECKPEKVRIVIVDDCSEHKSKSSESCSEESEEIGVIMPRERSRSKH